MSKSLDHLSIPPLCEWIRRDNKGVIQVLTPAIGRPKSQRESHGWVPLSNISEEFFPYVQARVQKSFEGVDNKAVAAWEEVSPYDA